MIALGFGVILSVKTCVSPFKRKMRERKCVLRLEQKFMDMHVLMFGMVGGTIKVLLKRLYFLYI